MEDENSVRQVSYADCEMIDEKVAVAKREGEEKAGKSTVHIPNPLHGVASSYWPESHRVWLGPIGIRPEHASAACPSPARLASKWGM